MIVYTTEDQKYSVAWVERCQGCLGEYQIISHEDGCDDGDVVAMFPTQDECVKYLAKAGAK